MAAERDLLLGLIALQNGLIDQGQLVAAFQAWARDKGRSLADHLAARGDLDAEQRAGVEAMVALHLKKYGDVGRSLAAVPAGHSTREGLARLGDPDIEATLLHCGSTDVGGADRTASYAVGAATSEGQRFRVLRPHARGGLGAVFVALDAELNREVALKQILDHHADDPASRQRFMLEAEVTGGLEHPGIVPVYGLGAYADGRPYYAMRFIRGDSLKEAIDRFHADPTLKQSPGRRSLEFRKLLRRLTDVCNAIDYAHSRGVLHRDIKPGNIIVGKHGETLVVDWGLAKPLGRFAPGGDSGERTFAPSSGNGSAETLPGSALGTPAFMSPEQARGDIKALGAQSDVYSLGATMYSLLTDEPPFTGDDVGEMLRRVQSGDFPPPSGLDPSIDRALEAVCLKAMALKPEDRYPSPKAMADDIERWMADEPVSSYKEPLSRRLSRWARRHKPLVAGAAALMATAVVALVVSNVAVQREKRETETQRDVARRKSREATETARTLERQLYVNRVNLAQREWLANYVGPADSLLDACPPELRGWEWSYCKRLCRTSLLNMGEGVRRLYGMDLSPDGRLIASASEENGLTIWDAATGQARLKIAASYPGWNYARGPAFTSDGRQVVWRDPDGGATFWDVESGRPRATFQKTGNGGGQFTTFAISRDGLILASNSGQAIRLWDVGSGKIRSTLNGHAGGVCGLAFSPDGGSLASAGWDGAVRLWDVRTGRETAAMRAQEGPLVIDVAFSPDGSRIASAGWDNTVRVWSAPAGTPIHVMRGHASFIRGVAFSPDGSKIASASEDYTVKLWDAEAGAEVETFRGHTGHVTEVEFSHDGTQLISSAFDGTVQVWDVTRGQQSMTVYGHSGWAHGVAFSPDGKRIVSGGSTYSTRPGELSVRDAFSGAVVFNLYGHADWVRGVAYSPDGRFIASSSNDHAIGLWDASDGHRLHSLLGHTGIVGSVAFSPDGSRVASASDDGTARLWDVATGKHIHHSSDIMALCVQLLSTRRVGGSPRGASTARSGSGTP